MTLKNKQKKSSYLSQAGSMMFFKRSNVKPINVFLFYI